MSSDLISSLIAVIPLLMCLVIWFFIFKLNRKTQKNLRIIEDTLEIVKKKLNDDMNPCVNAIEKDISAINEEV